MENTNVTSDTQQAVVAPEQNLSVTGGAAPVNTGVGTDAQSAARRQTRAENSGFRKLRLENEGYKKEIERLQNEVLDRDRLKAESDIYIRQLASDRMNADLEAIRSIAPDVTSLSGLGEQFIRLIENGIDAKTAFAAVKGANEGTFDKKPPSIGAVGNTEGASSRFFTSKELDRLTKKDLQDPKIFKKAMESLKKL